MREIGSEFWDVPVVEQNNGLFPPFTQWYLSGRSALKAIIKDMGEAKSVAIPSWCCDSMVKPFVDAGYKIHFYPVYWQGSLIQELEFDCDVLLLMDYFGYSAPVVDLNDYKGVIIRDLTHSILTATSFDADYYFGSLRKWCGVWTGGYAWEAGGSHLPVCKTSDINYVSLREEAMKKKQAFLSSRAGNDKAYLKLFSDAEECLENAEALQAEDRDVALAQILDVETLRRKRRTNAKILRSAFTEWLIFPEMNGSDCPMFVPIIVPDERRDELRNFLIDKDIYCPIHWPVSKYHKLDNRSAYLFKNELSLVCDQRYSPKDMNRMVEAISTFWEVTK